VAEYWCELAWLGGADAEAEVLIAEQAGVITSVVAGSPCPPGATRLAGLTLPGFANAHSHAFHRVLRSRAQGGRGSFWTWRDQMYAAAERLDPDSYYALARAVYGEMALAGITCVGEFHYLHHGQAGAPYADPNAMGNALVAAAADARVRITLIDACYLRGGFDAPLSAAQQRFSDGDAIAWAARAASRAKAAHARHGAAVHSVRAVDPHSITVIAQWAADHDVVLHAHVSEQPLEVEQCRRTFGRTPVQLLADCGALGGRFTAVHATHAAEADIELLGSASCFACICPTTERDLADGVGPARRLRDAGARLTLGTDSQAVIDMFEEARGVEMNERLAARERGRHTSAELLQAATAVGHASLGWPDAGRLAVGSPADLVSVRLDSVRTAGAGAECALSAAVFAATAADVHHVVSGGVVSVSGGAHVSLDVAAEMRVAVGALLGRP
jgi:formiminoglutamate deiminase